LANYLILYAQSSKIPLAGLCITAAAGTDVAPDYNFIKVTCRVSNQAPLTFTIDIVSKFFPLVSDTGQVTFSQCIAQDSTLLPFQKIG